MNIYDILAELEQEVGEGKPGLFHKKLDVNNLAELVYKLKQNMPKAVEEAAYVLSQKEKIVNSAKSDAKAVLEDANNKAKAMIAENAITKRAEDEARKMLEQTLKRCEQLLDTTKNNVDKILKAVEDYLSEHLNIVHDSRDELSSTLVQLKNNLKKD